MHLNSWQNMIFSRQRWMLIRLWEAHLVLAHTLAGLAAHGFTLTPQGFAAGVCLRCSYASLCLCFLFTFSCSARIPAISHKKLVFPLLLHPAPSQLTDQGQHMYGNGYCSMLAPFEWRCCNSGIICKGNILTKWDFTFLLTVIVLILNINHINI